jgi:hypothetical protein
MKDEKISKRIADCTSVEMQFIPKENSFYGKFDYISDFNVHYTEMLCSTDEEWEKIITGLRNELKRRQEKEGIIAPVEEPRKKAKKILIASTGNELGIRGAIGNNAKLLEKLGDDVEFIDMANIPEGMTVEGLSKEDIIDMGRPYMDTLRSMPPMEIKLMEHALEDFRYGHLSKKEREADIQPIRTEPKYQRNDPCPCGSGKKYKNCCINKAK